MWPSTEAVLTIWPEPRSIMDGRKARQPWMTPHRLTPRHHSHDLSVSSEIGPVAATPALLQSTSAGPKAAVQASRSASTDGHEDTSQVTATASPPASVDGLDGLVQGRLLDVGHYHPHGLGREALGHPPAHAAGPAGDHGHPAGEILHGASAARAS